MRRWKRAEKKRAEETDGLVGRTVPLLSFFNGSQAVLPVGWVVGWPAGLWGGKGRGWKRGYQNEGVVFSFFFSRCGHRDKAGRQAGRQADWPATDEPKFFSSFSFSPAFFSSF